MAAAAFILLFSASGVEFMTSSMPVTWSTIEPNLIVYEYKMIILYLKSTDLVIRFLHTS